MNNRDFPSFNDYKNSRELIDNDSSDREIKTKKRERQRFTSAVSRIMMVFTIPIIIILALSSTFDSGSDVSSPKTTEFKYSSIREQSELSLELSEKYNWSTNYQSTFDASKYSLPSALPEKSNTALYPSITKTVPSISTSSQTPKRTTSKDSSIPTVDNKDSSSSKNVTTAPSAPSSPSRSYSSSGTPSSTRDDPIANTYIGNKNSKKFHRPSCSYLPDQKNQVTFDSREEAINKGYDPCGHCNP